MEYVCQEMNVLSGQGDPGSSSSTNVSGREKPDAGQSPKGQQANLGTPSR
jgi:hypothetical protein